MAGGAVGGRRAAREAVRAGLARSVLVVRGSARTQGLQALLAAAEEAGVGVRWVERTEIDRLGLREHQGVAALTGPGREMDERDLSTFDFPADALAVMLDGIMDPQNLGACARSAEAAGASLLITRKRRAAPSTPSAVRASAGALLHLPTARVANLPRALERLSERRFTVVGLDHRAEVSIHDGPPPARPLTLVIGSEGEGLSRLVRESCDQLVSIPIVGRTASLNASAALAVALFGYALRPPTGP
jgi:23S rRNA (guanosine2251-2'-O)-methyltransferase